MHPFNHEIINVTDIIGVWKYENTEQEIRKNPVVNHGTTKNYYQIIFFLQGDNTTQYGNTVIYDRPNSIRFLPAKNSDIYRVERHAADACIDIYFTTSTLLSPDAFGYYEMDFLRNKFEKIYNLWQCKNQGYYVQCMLMFYEIIDALKSTENSYISNSQRIAIENAHTYIMNNFKNTHFNYNELCSVTGLSYSYFKTLFIRQYNMSPVKYVTMMKVQYAKDLLISSLYSVTEISEMCGFENVYYFSRVFKNLTGVSPGKYIKHN